MCSEPGLPPARGARLDQVLARRPRQLVYGGRGPTTRLVRGYLACDARLAGMLLAGLPALVRVNVRGSSAGVWLEASKTTPSRARNGAAYISRRSCGARIPAIPYACTGPGGT